MSHDDAIPEADRLEQLEPAQPEAGRPRGPRTEDLEAPEPDVLEQGAPVAAVVDDRPPPIDDDRLVDLSDDWEER